MLPASALLVAALALVPAAALGAAFGGLAAPTLEAPALPTLAASSPWRGALATPEGGPESANDVGLSLPADEAEVIEEAVSAAADRYVAAGVSLGNAVIRNGTATVNHLARRELPDRELFNLTNAGAAFAQASVASSVAFAGDSVVLTQGIVAAKDAEADALRARAAATATLLGDQAEAFGFALAADVPVAAQAVVAEGQRIAGTVTVDPAPARAPLDAAMADAQGWAGATTSQANAHLVALQADVEVTLARELAMQGVVGAEVAAAGATAAGSAAATSVFAGQSAALGADTAQGTMAGLDSGAILVPFHAVEALSLHSADLLAATAFVVRDGGIEAMEGSGPVQWRAAAALRTAANVTVAGGEAARQAQVAGRALLDDVCADPFAQPPPEECRADSVANRAEAVLQHAEDAATLSAGAARARLSTTFDAQASGGVALLNQLGRSIGGASAKMASSASDSVVTIPLTDLETAASATLGYGQATEDRLAPLAPGLASDLSAEPGEALFRTVALAATAGAAAGDAALASEHAASHVVGAALR